MSRKFLNIILVAFVLFVITFLPAMAEVLIAEDEVTGANIFSADRSVYVFIWNMLPAWLYLGGAVTMLVLSLKFMSGGALARPFTLMGIGVLVDAVIQISASLSGIGLLGATPATVTQILLALSIASRLSVVFGMFWIANIFGIIKSQ